MVGAAMPQSLLKREITLDHNYFKNNFNEKKESIHDSKC